MVIYYRSNFIQNACCFKEPNITILGIQLCIPIQKVHPTFMQIIRGKFSSNIHHLMRLRTYWFTPQMKSRILKCFRPLFQITWTTSRNDICPISSSTLGPWHYMVKRQITFGTAILTRKLISKKKVKSGKCYFFLRPNIILQYDYRWYFYTY